MTWNGRRAALSLTFDDGLPCQLVCAIPEMDRLGIRGTFFLPTNCPDYPVTWAQWTGAIERGHEIGSHSHTHRKAASLSQHELQLEARLSKLAIRSNLGINPTSFCYPYTDAPRDFQDAVRAEYLQARGGRTARRDKYATPGDNLNLFNTPCYHVNGKVFADMEIFAWIDAALERGAWLTLMLHGVGQDGTWDNVPLPEFCELMKFLADARDKRGLWIATFHEAATHYRAARR